MRKLKALKDQPDSPAGFPFAVCEVRSGADSEIIAWFKTERDAKFFAEAEKTMAETKENIAKEQARNASTYTRGYVRGCLGM